MLILLGYRQMDVPLVCLFVFMILLDVFAFDS